MKGKMCVGGGGVWCVVGLGPSLSKDVGWGEGEGYRP